MGWMGKRDRKERGNGKKERMEEEGRTGNNGEVGKNGGVRKEEEVERKRRTGKM